MSTLDISKEEYAALLRIANNRAYNASDAPDIVQSAVLSTLEHLAQGMQLEKPQHYLMRAVALKAGHFNSNKYVNTLPLIEDGEEYQEALTLHEADPFKEVSALETACRIVKRYERLSYFEQRAIRADVSKQRHNGGKHIINTKDTLNTAKEKLLRNL